MSLKKVIFVVCSTGPGFSWQHDGFGFQDGVSIYVVLAGPELLVVLPSVSQVLGLQT